MEPVFDVVGHKTLWLGPAGNGSKLKLALNSWLAAQVEAAAGTIAFTEALGMNPHLFADTLAETPDAVLKWNTMIDRAFRPGFPLRHALKDARLALAAARAQGEAAAPGHPRPSTTRARS